MSDIPPELLAEMTPAVRAFVESLMVQMAEMQARMQAEIDELKAQVKNLTPKNSPCPLRLSIRMLDLRPSQNRNQRKNVAGRTDTNARFANLFRSKNVRK